MTRGIFYGGTNRSEERFCFVLGSYEAFIGPWRRDLEVVRNVGNYILNSVALIPHNHEDITLRRLLKSRTVREETAASVLTVENTVKDCK